jgi:HAD superfamily hydrolase (TIGR01484 family)
MAVAPRVLFSDLDGTFLDDEYRPVLGAATLADVARKWNLVWATSRTADEIVHLQSSIGHTGDAIGENGGIIVSRSRDTASAFGQARPVGDAWVACVASPVQITESMVAAAFRDADVPFRTITQFDPGELARRSRYSIEDAVRAQQRRASVLLADIDEHHASVERALAELRRGGCAVLEGGRWISVVHGADKASTARAWLRARFGDVRAEVAAIGNAANDAPLLAMADRAFVVRNPVRGHLGALAGIPGARLLDAVGTAGWLEMMKVLR